LRVYVPDIRSIKRISRVNVLRIAELTPMAASGLMAANNHVRRLIACPNPGRRHRPVPGSQIGACRAEQVAGDEGRLA
jgi:hypothetical protein